MSKLSSLENPFANIPHGNPDTAAYVEKVLGKAEADKYRKLEDRRVTRNVYRVSSEEVELTDEERARAAEREKEIAEHNDAQEKRETRQRLVDWVEEFDLSEGYGAEEWIEKKFKFLPSGEAESIGDLWLEDCGLTYLPKGIIRVNGVLGLNHNKKLTTLENLPKQIVYSLFLIGIPATSIPAELLVGSVIKMSLRQKELIADAKRKGYGLQIQTL